MATIDSNIASTKLETCIEPIRAVVVTAAVAEPALKSGPPSVALSAGMPTASQATALAELAAEAEFWHASDGTAYATIQVDSWREHWRLRSRPFMQWLVRRYFTAQRAAPYAAALTDALALLEARARFDGEQRQVFLRVAGHDGHIHLDLADRQWRSVVISPGRWSVVERPPVPFRRAKSMLALPQPRPGGSLTMLRQFINVSDDDWPLVASWLVAALLPTGPYPILFLHGEQGSGKSTQARVLRSLVDPNSAPLRAAPRELRDLALAAHNGWVISLDNLSRLPVWLSDALCRVSTGGGFATRSLKEDEDESVFDGQRPVLINGIDDLANRGDLLDRALLVHLPAIGPGKRRTEVEFWREFDECRPLIVGALIEAAATALARLPSIALPDLPRLADFAQWASAAEPSLGCAPGTIQRLYARHKVALDRAALEACPIVEPLFTIVSEGPWRGTVAQLVRELEQRSGAKERPRRDWPRGFAQLSGLLRRLAPSLRAFGVEVEFVREGHRGARLIEMRIATAPEKRKTSASSNQNEAIFPAAKNRTNC